MQVCKKREISFFFVEAKKTLQIKLINIFRISLCSITNLYKNSRLILIHERKVISFLSKKNAFLFLVHDVISLVENGIHYSGEF